MSLQNALCRSQMPRLRIARPEARQIVLAWLTFNWSIRKLLPCWEKRVLLRGTGAIEYSISARSALLSAARRTARGQQLAADLPLVPICTGEGRVAFDVPLGIAGNNFART